MNRIVSLFVVCGLMGYCVQIGNAQTVAERLGYPADAKLLIVHGDDVGMCHAHNVAAMKALEKGIVTSCSIMVPCPWFLEIAQYARENTGKCFGLHLTLTSEWKFYRWRPLAALDKVKGLIDPEGYMHHEVEGVYQFSNAAEAEAEVRAQIEHALARGIEPTHLDSHMGTLYYNPEFFQMILKLSEEYDIPFMYFNPDSPVLQRTNNPMGVDAAKQMQARGIPLLDELVMIDNVPVEQSDEYYTGVIRNLKPGVTEIIIHMAEESEEIRHITGSWRQRAADLRFFTDPKTKELIEEENVILIGWKDLLPLWKARKR